MEIPDKRVVIRLLWGTVGALLTLVLPCSAQTYFYSRATFATGNKPVAAVAEDFNGDGILDLAVVNQNDNTVSVLLGKADASFAPKVDYPVGEFPTAIVAADFNGDGKLDLAVVNSVSSTVSILLGNGDGTFEGQVPYATGFVPVGVAAGDFNDDGKLDLAVVNNGDSTVSILLGNGDGTFSSGATVAVGGSPIAIASGDFNGDGKIDLIALNNPLSPEAPTVTVLLSKGNGSFTLVVTDVGLQPNALVVGDFDNDGKLDACVLFGGNAIDFLRGQGDGTFQVVDPPFQTFNATTLVAADLNHDGKLDLVAAGEMDAAVLLGVGDGTFQWGPYVGSVLGLVLLSADINGDGVPDLVFGDLSNNEVWVLLGSGDGTFGTAPDYDLFALYPPNNIGFGPAIAADFNGDGKTDLAVFEFEYGQGPGEIAVGLGNGNGSFQAPISSASEPAAIAIVLGDFNGDGKMDFAGWSGEVLSIYLGNGDGTFQSPLDVSTPPGPIVQALAVADFNGDGIPDLAIVTETDSPTAQENVQILLGQGNGNFITGASISLESAAQLALGFYFAGAVYLVAGDFNHDGKIDLAAADTLTVAVLLGKGDGTFQNPVFYNCRSCSIVAMAAGDFNGDGNLDLVMSNYDGVSVFLGNGDGTFQAPLDTLFGGGGGQIIVGDFNGDGKLDLAFADNVLVGNGDGTFQPTVHNLRLPPGAVAVGDFNSDGIPDLAIGTQLFETTPFITLALSAPQIALLPSPLTFGPVEVGMSSAAKEVSVTNIGNAPMTISGIVPGGDYSQTNTCGVTIPVGASCAISVIFAPTAVGTRSGTIILNDNLKTSPQRIVLSGMGVAPTISLSPASLTFGGQSMGATSPAQNVTLRNTGNMPLIVYGIAVDGDFAQTNNCGTGFDAGLSCTIGVTFTPTGNGTRSGRLTIADNAPDSPQSLALTGSGPDFTLAIAGNSSTSATVNAGQTATYTLVLSATQGFNGTVSLACSGAPQLSTCNVTPQSPALGGTAQTNVTISVTTTAGSAVVPTTHSRPHALWTRPQLVIGAMLVWLLALILAKRREPRCATARAMLRHGHRGLPVRRHLEFASVLFILLILGALAMPCCGGGSGGGGGTSGTPAGTYNITVTATAGSGASALSHGMTLTLNVS
jgi:hypothetical protein